MEYGHCDGVSGGVLGGRGRSVPGCLRYMFMKAAAGPVLIFVE